MKLSRSSTETTEERILKKSIGKLGARLVRNQTKRTYYARRRRSNRRNERITATSAMIMAACNEVYVALFFIELQMYARIFEKYKIFRV